MAEITAQGRVVEARPSLLVLRYGTSLVEYMHDGLKPYDARPGDYVFIYDDGQVEVRGRDAANPDIMVPGHPQLGGDLDSPQQDHC